MPKINILRDNRFQISVLKELNLKLNTQLSLVLNFNFNTAGDAT